MVKYYQFKVVNIAGVNDIDDVLLEWTAFVIIHKENDLVQLIDEGNLKLEETRAFINNCLTEGEAKTTGTDIEKILPPTSRFSGGNIAEKKQGVINKILIFFEKNSDLGISIAETEKKAQVIPYDFTDEQDLKMVAEDNAFVNTENIEVKERR